MKTMIELSWPSVLRASLLATALATACGGSTGGVAGGESHFLSYCSDECDQGLDCISGVCTRTCLVSESGCGDLGEGVTCTDQSIEPGEVAVCDLDCEEDLDCNTLGEGYRCESGYCRHDPATSSSSSGGSASGGSGSGGGSNGGSCELLFMQFEDGETGIPDPVGCGTCECSDGSLECSEEACQNADAQVFQCPLVDGNVVEPMSDPIEVLASRFEGDTLVLEVGYSGCSSDRAFGLCYMDAFLESDPVQGSLRLIYDGRGSPCGEYHDDLLRFDLTPYAQFYFDAYPTDTGEIQTAYGNYVFGELDCQTRSNLSEAQVFAAMEMVGTHCDSDEDCAWWEIDSGCSPVPICSAMVGTGSEGMGSESIDLAITNIAESVCGDFEADGCMRDNLPRECVGTPELFCDSGECAEVAP